MKATLATLKSFVRKNDGKLHILVGSTFSGMTDCVESTGNHHFKPVTKRSQEGRAFDLSDIDKHTLGLNGVWLVGSSRDYIEPFSADGFTGYRVDNCCGHFTIAVQP